LLKQNFFSFFYKFFLALVALALDSHYQVDITTIFSTSTLRVALATCDFKWFYRKLFQWLSAGFIAYFITKPLNLYKSYKAIRYLINAVSFYIGGFSIYNLDFSSLAVALASLANYSISLEIWIKVIL